MQCLACTMAIRGCNPLRRLMRLIVEAWWSGWMETISGQYCWKMASWILPCRWRKTSGCVAVRSRNGKVFLGITVVTFTLSTARTAWCATGIAGITQEREWHDSGDGLMGSGKSTTLAAMVGYLNQHADAHILTLEDPGRYLTPASECLIQQRESGLH